MSTGAEPEEVELARRHAQLAEKCDKQGRWSEGTFHASMATMYLAIADRKERTLDGRESQEAGA